MKWNLYSCRQHWALWLSTFLKKGPWSKFKIQTFMKKIQLFLWRISRISQPILDRFNRTDAWRMSLKWEIGKDWNWNCFELVAPWPSLFLEYAFPGSWTLWSSLLQPLHVYSAIQGFKGFKRPANPYFCKTHSRKDGGVRELVCWFELTWLMKCKQTKTTYKPL